MRRRTRNIGQPTPPRFMAGFLAPKYWPTWGWLLLLRVLMICPRRWLMAVGAKLGRVIGARNAKRRKIAAINLALCFPDWSAARRAQLLNEHFQHYGRALLDVSMGLWSNRARRNRWCVLKRRDWLVRTSKRRRVIIVAYHMTALDVSGCIAGDAHPMVSMMNRAVNPLLTWQLWKGRSHARRGNTRVVMREQGLLPLVRAMRAGRNCFLVPDEDFGVGKHGVFAPFFGASKATLTVVARLAKMTDALVVPSTTRLDETTGRYEMTLGEPLADFPSGDAAADARAVNRAMQELIRQHPAQYMWTFRWFETRPFGAPNPYKTSR